MEQHRVLPHRADPRPRRQLPFEDRPGVHVAPGLAAGERRADALFHGPEVLADDLVIVLPAGVAGHPAPEVPGRLRLPLAVLPVQRVVLEGHAEDAAGAGEDLRRIEPRLQPPAEVLHPRLIPPVEPAHQGLAVLQRIKPGHPGAVETGFQCPGLQEVGAGVHAGSISFEQCLDASNIVWPSQTMFGSKKQCLGAFFIVWDRETMF